MQKGLSIKAIAKELSISPTTVSFILNDKALDNRISQALIDRVKDHIKKIGYQPNQLAKSLRTGRSKMIVFMVQDISNPYFAAVAKAIEQSAYKEGYTVIYCSMDNDPEKTRGLIQQFSNLRVEGYIITTPGGMNPSEINQLIKNGNAVVLCDRQPPGVNSSHVMLDNIQDVGLRLQLALHLIQILFTLMENPKVHEIRHVELSGFLRERELMGQLVN